MENAPFNEETEYYVVHHKEFVAPGKQVVVWFTPIKERAEEFVRNDDRLTYTTYIADEETTITDGSLGWFTPGSEPDFSEDAEDEDFER